MISFVHRPPLMKILGQLWIQSAEILARPVARDVAYIVSLFVATRLVLTGIGVLGLLATKAPRGITVDNRFLDIWGIWDTGWYLDIVTQGYSAVTQLDPSHLGQSNLAFFPAYPLAIKSLSAGAGLDPFVAGILVSNGCLLVSCFLIWRLAARLEGETVGLLAVKYLLVFPTAFVFSAVLSESLFLALSLGCFYAATKNRWDVAGSLGLVAALTRPVGVLLLIPLLLEFFTARSPAPRRLGSLGFLGLIPLGYVGYAAFNAYLTGNPFAFQNIQQGWGKALSNPAAVLMSGLLSGRSDAQFEALTALAGLAALLIFSRYLRPSYLLYGFLLIGVPLSYGLNSLPRYLAVIFPLYLGLACLGRNQRLDQILTICSALLQGLLFVVWSGGFGFVV